MIYETNRGNALFSGAPMDYFDTRPSPYPTCGSGSRGVRGEKQVLSEARVREDGRDLTAASSGMVSMVQ